MLFWTPRKALVKLWRFGALLGVGASAAEDGRYRGMEGTLFSLSATKHGGSQLEEQEFRNAPGLSDLV